MSKEKYAWSQVTISQEIITEYWKSIASWAISETLSAILQISSEEFEILQRMYGLISAFVTQEFISFWWLITGSLLKPKGLKLEC